MTKAIFAATGAAMLLISPSIVHAAGIVSFSGNVAFDNSADGGSDTTIQKKGLTSVSLDFTFGAAMPTPTTTPDGEWVYTYNDSPNFSFGLAGGGTAGDGSVITDTDSKAWGLAANGSGQIQVLLTDNLNVPTNFSAPGIADGDYDIIGMSFELFVFDRTGLGAADPNPTDATSSIEIIFYGAFAEGSFGATAPTEFPDVFGLDPAFWVAAVSEFKIIGGFPDPNSQLGAVELLGGGGQFDSYSLTVSDVPVPGALPLAMSGITAMLWLGRRNRKSL